MFESEKRRRKLCRKEALTSRSTHHIMLFEEKYFFICPEDDFRLYLRNDKNESIEWWVAAYKRHRSHEINQNLCRQNLSWWKCYSIWRCESSTIGLRKAFDLTFMLRRGYVTDSSGESSKTQFDLWRRWRVFPRYPRNIDMYKPSRKQT